MTTPESPNSAAPKFKPEPTEDTPKKPRGPGATLRAERESKNMAVSHVGSLLRLDSGVITALENDDVANLPSATFVKGYLRSYGRLLNLDGEKLVAAYTAIVDTQELPLYNAATVPEKRSGAGRWVFFLLVIAAIVALAWYWSKPSEQPVSTDTLTPDQSFADKPIASETEATQATPQQAVTSASGGYEDSDTADTADEVIEQLLRGLKDERIPAATTAEPEVSKPAATESGTAEGEVVANAAETSEVSVPNEAEQAPAEPEAEPVAETASQDSANDRAAEEAAEPADPKMISLKLTGLKESWVSIRDAREQRVYRNLLKAGASPEVKGLAPLLVHFGNAQGVRLEVNGQVYDHSSWHKSNGTARFILNPVQ